MLKNHLVIPLLFIGLLGQSQSIDFRTNSRTILGLQKDRTASVSLGDIDNDGDIDAVVANGRHWPQQNQVFFNSGKGKFTVSQPLAITSETSYATELADFDLDGDLDVAVGNDQAPKHPKRRPELTSSAPSGQTTQQAAIPCLD